MEGIGVEAYSSAAFRSFKAFIGELTAVAAGVYVGIQEVVPVVEGCGTDDPWRSVAQRHGVLVNALTSEQVVNSSVRLNLVSLYSGFDLFMADMRDQFHELHGREWVQHDKDGPFDALARNTPSQPRVHTERLGLHRIATMDHYRLVRNAIAHPRQQAIEASKKFFSSNAELLMRARSEYEMQTAPNALQDLTFHDIKMLARVALDLTRAIDSDFDPGDECLRLKLASQAVDRAKSPERRRNALLGWLRTHYGVSVARAERIVDLHMTHQLGG